MHTSSSAPTRRSFVTGAAIAAGAACTAATLPPAAHAEEAGLPTEWDYEADLVIVGGGGAGIMAALSASEKGASSLILEKASHTGGDTQISEQNYLGPVACEAEKFGFEESPEKWIEDNLNSHGFSMKGLRGEPVSDDLSLVETYCELCEPTYLWLRDTAGVQWQPDTLCWDNRYGKPGWDTVYPRSFNSTDGCMNNITDMAESDENVQIVTDARVTEIVIDGTGRAVGVKVCVEGQGTKTAKAHKGVLISTGSFNGDRQMVNDYLGYDAACLVPHNCPSNTGDGIKLAQAAGAQMRDLGLGSAWFPSTRGSHSLLSFVNWSHFGDIPEGCDIPTMKDADQPGLLVNYDGRRYASETSGYSVGGYLLHQQKWGQGFYVVDSDGAVIDDDGSLFMAGTSLGDDNIITADTLEELGQRMNVDVESFLDEVEKFNGYVEAGEDPDFGRAMRNVKPVQTAPFYAVPLEAQHYTTFGGIAVDTETRVLGTDGNPIPGLFAAGIVCGSFTEQAGLYYGSGVAQAFIFGRLAGQVIADEEPQA